MNIIFDLGGVVITWDPDKLIADVFTDTRIQKLARKYIIDHHDWIELDRGMLKKSEAIRRGAKRSGISETEVSRLLTAVPHYLNPVQDSIRLIRELKEFKNQLFILSNLHIESLKHLESTHSFFNLFDGAVISCRIHKVKPEAEIYYHLIDTYQLQITNTVFIDDTIINLESAAKIGIKTIHFKDPEQCRHELIKLGCLS